MNPVLADLLSRAPDRLLSSASLVNHTRDVNLLNTLVTALPDIRRATRSLDLGGMLFPNKNHVLQAIRVIENYSASRCFCRIYSGYPFYDPCTEEKDGHVRMTHSDLPTWNMSYTCVCTICGQEYFVQQGKYHYTWWEWTEERGAGRR